MMGLGNHDRIDIGGDIDLVEGRNGDGLVERLENGVSSRGVML